MIDNQITQVIQTRIDNGHLVELNLFTKQATIIYKENAVTPFVFEISSEDMLKLIFANGQNINFTREICMIEKKEKPKQYEKTE